MNPIGYLPYLVYQDRRNELLNEAAQIRLLNEAMQIDKAKINLISKFLAFFGRELSSVGFSLEVRYGSLNEMNNSLYQQSSTNNCQ
jgi:hypothetical protein